MTPADFVTPVLVVGRAYQMPVSQGSGYRLIRRTF